MAFRITFCPLLLTLKKVKTAENVNMNNLMRKKAQPGARDRPIYKNRCITTDVSSVTVLHKASERQSENYDNKKRGRELF